MFLLVIEIVQYDSKTVTKEIKKTRARPKTSSKRSISCAAAIPMKKSTNVLKKGYLQFSEGTF